MKIYEYQPQVLHAKLIIVDDAVYVGSANLDPRSLGHQLRADDPLCHEGDGRRRRGPCLPESLAALPAGSRAKSGAESRTIWRRLKQRWAYWLLVRIDPYIARWRVPDVWMRQWSGQIAQVSRTARPM